MGILTVRWLTELQCRKTQEEVTEEAAPAKAKDDEDGPGSSEGEEAKDFTDDDESMSSTEERPTNDALSIPTFVGYFEKQRDARCGLHALNNCVGGWQGYRTHTPKKKLLNIYVPCLFTCVSV